MAGIEYKPAMKKEELLKIAAEHGIEADDTMTKPEIIALLEAANAERPADGPKIGPQDPAEDGGGAGEGNDTTHDENAVQSVTEGQQDPDSESGGNFEADKPGTDPQEAPQGYDLFVYAGPSLPRGRLKENTVFRGTFEDVKTYLSDVLEDYPQIERLIVPANRLAAFSVKVKTPGNIAHKYYGDIVSAMRGSKEV